MPLIRCAPLPQCRPPPAVEKFGVPKSRAEGLEGHAGCRHRRGALHHQLARVVARMRQAGDLIERLLPGNSFQPGSMPMPFRDWSRRSGWSGGWGRNGS